jgi:RimJ/RimL family protein N-acetyltransferase
MQFTIRAVRAEDWQLVKELRLASLQDPVASIAFPDTYERSVVQADEFWQGRTADAAEGKTVRQFIGEDGDGRWLGTVTVLVEQAGVQDYFGQIHDIAQTHVVGVYVRPEARGTGLAQGLFEAALGWSWALPDPSVARVRLYVHEDNARARALYEKVGFTRTGVAVAVPAGREFEYAVARG